MTNRNCFIFYITSIKMSLHKMNRKIRLKIFQIDFLTAYYLFLINDKYCLKSFFILLHSRTINIKLQCLIFVLNSQFCTIDFTRLCKVMFKINWFIVFIRCKRVALKYVRGSWIRKVNSFGEVV